MPIHILTEDVASQIAAGEVVERPASVVKELLENSLDAGSRSITINVVAAGRQQITVSDDGVGIPAEELKLALTRYATSKLNTAADLFRITTLGFRGEALASIASVSRLSIISRHESQNMAARLVVEGGAVVAEEAHGGPQGTLVSVESLFFNVPARLKFLKRDSTERQQIDSLVTRYAIAYPGVRFDLIQDGKRVLQTTGRGDRREIMASLYGVEISRQLLEISLKDEGLEVSGYVSPITLTRSNRKEITFFVNGRWVQDNSLTSAILKAYRTYLMVGRFPLGVLFISMDPEWVDVNVHPAKAEVRFRQPDRVFSIVQRSVRRGLLAYSPFPPVYQQTWNDGGRLTGQRDQLETWKDAIHPSWQMSTEEAAVAGKVAPDGNQLHPPGAGPETHTQEPLRSAHFPILRLIGQIGATYLVAEGPDGLYLVDQHAAHERILFEKYLNLGRGEVLAQNLLEPCLLQLPPHSSALLEAQLPTLEKLGFLVDPFGPGAFRIRAIPEFLGNIDPGIALRSIVEDFEEDETQLQSQMENRLIARICKRVAIKGGQLLSVAEQEALIRDLEKCSSPRTCPHGRPTMIHLSIDLLERQFGRKGSR